MRVEVSHQICAGCTTGNALVRHTDASNARLLAADEAVTSAATTEGASLLDVAEALSHGVPEGTAEILRDMAAAGVERLREISLAAPVELGIVVCHRAVAGQPKARLFCPAVIDNQPVQ